MKTDKIALIGLGKLGLPLLSTFAKNDQKIIGIDVDHEKIRLLKNNKTPFYEPNLEEYLDKGANNIEYYEDFVNVVDDVDAAIILVNTPSDINGEFSNIFVFEALDKISKCLKNNKKDDFLIIVSSTVMPGSHDIIIKHIEQESGRKLNDRFGVVYMPDLVALGSVIYDFENPDLVIMGQSNEKYGMLAEQIYTKIFKNNPPIIKMSLIEAEITKVSLNAYITMKISFANFIGNVSEKFNCNSNNITKALGYDRRISPHYIKSGLSFGGTCFPRDTWAFIKMSENVGLNAIHIKATQEINDIQNKLLFEEVFKYKDRRIGVFGLSFKPNTSVTTESAGYMLYNFLKENGCTVYGCDELVDTDFTIDKFDYFLDNCDVVVIAHNNKMIVNKFSKKLSSKILVNPWKIEI